MYFKMCISLHIRELQQPIYLAFRMCHFLLIYPSTSKTRKIHVWQIYMRITNTIPLSTVWRSSLIHRCLKHYLQKQYTNSLILTAQKYAKYCSRTILACVINHDSLFTKLELWHFKLTNNESCTVFHHWSRPNKMHLSKTIESSY